MCGALTAHGLQVGLYTSPHLVHVGERMVVGDRPIQEAAFAFWTERLRPSIEATGASFFEATTAMAFADFASRRIDVGVIEVGLGGRLDATNVIVPMIAVVTSVSLEHTAYLGDTLEAIAREKAGIAKPGVPFVIGETDADLANVLATEGARLGALPIIVPPEERWQGPLRLRGEHQRRNAAVAAAALRQLTGRHRVPEHTIERAFGATVVAGRFDVRGRWIFDVAHNAAGARTLATTLVAEHPVRPLHALVSVLNDKDWSSMLTTLLPVVDRMWVTTAPTAPPERRWRLDEVGARFGSAVVVEADFERALDQVIVGAGTALVTGSFHTVGDAMARLPGFAPLG